MYAIKPTNGETKTEVEENGVSTPIATPLPVSEDRNALASKPFKADVEEGDSPKMVAADAVSKPDEEVAKKDPQEEDSKDDSEARDGDIYADAVLACSIENPESCVMCSG
jgi:ribonucleoside-diphosphate reductase subunit M1